MNTKTPLRRYPIDFPRILVESAVDSIFKACTTNRLFNPEKAGILLSADIPASETRKTMSVAPDQDFVTDLPDEYRLAQPADFLAFMADILQYSHKVREVFGRDKTSVICLELVTLRNGQQKHLVLSWVGGTRPVKLRFLNHRPGRKSIDNKNFRPLLLEMESE